MKRFLTSPLGFVLLVNFLAAIALLSFRIATPPPAHAASQFANIICDQFKPVSLTGSTQIITAGGTNQFIYVCSYNLTVAGADNVAIVEGTGTTCASNTAGMSGGSTAATGLQFTGTNPSPINYGGGSGAVLKTATAGDNVCILPSTSVQVSGVVGWTSAPF